MRMLRWVCVLALLVSGIGSATDQKQQDLWLHGRVDIGVDGRVSNLAWDSLPPLQQLVADRITEQVKSWEFIPAMVDGRPMPTRTGLMVHMQAIEDGNGSVDLRLVDARTGAITANLVPPPYPRDVATAGVSAMVVVELSIAADGTPIVHDMRYSGHGGNKQHRRTILSAVEAGMNAWTFHPEVVAGQTTGAKLFVPVVFCVEPAWCNARLKEARALTQSAIPDPTMQLAPDSVVSIKTRIAVPES